MSHTVEESTQTERVTGDTVFKRLETFVLHTTFKDPFYFYCIVAYVVMVFVCCCIMNYNSGKQALFKYIDLCKESGKKQDRERAWVAVKQGISERSWNNFLESIIVPYTLATSVMPHVVMYFNQGFFMQ